MGKFRVEVCLISARGLRRSLSLWKLQWFAVGWVDPNNKYCTKIDASGNANPTWKTKFSAIIDGSESNLQDLALHIQVYSREPVFLREKLQGVAAVYLKEFLTKYMKNSPNVSSPGTEEVGSFQLRKKNSNKPQGFIDVSLRISEEREGESSNSGNGEGFKLTGSHEYVPLAMEDGFKHFYPPQPLPTPLGQSENYPQMNSPNSHPMSFPIDNLNPSLRGPSYKLASGPSYCPPRTPPPPPPPSNVGYIPTFLLRADQLPTTYVNMPSSGAAPIRRSGEPGFAMGAGVGALAAGAVIFGDDFMSGFDFPAGLQDASLTISTDPNL
ncbi:PREDICTED: uncharacterized protein LOC104588384 isoform X2 [Nelumbo nucifera]|uniref:Uncharacterized protein LOC104588384 isoform X2 n=1 Tax=Nelumbo nucifera TaxID=4432 RepID=A0A1U7ZBG7_NELNU|nr:PREDICTED: uncharacterized protein LOC104588384 isoform X2 [Nelumbo nucifera]